MKRLKFASVYCFLWPPSPAPWVAVRAQTQPTRLYTQMAFWSDRAGSDAGGMWTMNLDGSSPTMVPFTQTSGEVYGPSMSAGGSSIILLSISPLDQQYEWQRPSRVASQPALQFT